MQRLDLPLHRPLPKPIVDAGRSPFGTELSKTLQTRSALSDIPLLTTAQPKSTFAATSLNLWQPLLVRSLVSEQYKSTALWKKSLGRTPAEHSGHMETLRAAYDDFRNKAFALTAQIAKTLPALTIHDGTHLDALWETADLIAGPTYPLNPLEGFVLGGAILLHDAALSFEAYKGGKEGLRSTTEWRDSYAAALQRQSGSSDQETKDEADFATLRLLHAKRAQELADAAWISPIGDQLFLIENSDLRLRYGPLIGKIAASHHWPIEEVSLLGGQFNAPGHFPRDWRVDPVKIACLLRCADAAHLDSRRAPDFLLALTRRQGVSANHWKAQNWLARADVSQQQGEHDAIVFTSNRDFSKADTDAWWVAYDAISLVQAEIGASNRLLASRATTDSPEFEIKRVKGVSSPEDLSSYVRTSGWEPCAAKIHVGNLQKLVNELGGTQLYGEGDQLGVALRELVQNSRDAIAARRIVEPGHEGRINIETFISDDGTLSLEISDNGVGMSERVITGPLLDFGSSFWASSLVQEEFPGLRSSTFRSVGKFGIGFYAIFMVAKSVVVSSRRWDAALEEVVSLNFPNGLTLRPTLSRGRPDQFPTAASTSVRMDLKAGFTTGGLIEINRNRVGEADFNVNLDDYIAALACGLDVNVYFKNSNEDNFKLIHPSVLSLTTEDKKSEWMSRNSFVKYGYTNVPDEEITKISQRLRFVDPSDPRFGLAALSARIGRGTTFLSTRTVGGLSTSVHGRGDDQFFGFLDYPARSAKREADQNTSVSQELLQEWANEQIGLLEKEGIDDLGRAITTCNLCDLKVDPIQIFRAVISLNNVHYAQTINQIFDISSTKGIAIFKSGHIDHVETYIDGFEYKDFPVFRPVKNSSFLSLQMDGNIPKDPYSFLGCLYREAQKHGHEIALNGTAEFVKSRWEECEVLLVTTAPKVA